MNERRLDSAGYIPKGSLGDTTFEQEIAFAYRWAIRRGKPEEIMFSEETFKQALDFLELRDIKISESENSADISVRAVKKFFTDHGLDGVNVNLKPFDKNGLYKDFIVLIVSPDK